MEMYIQQRGGSSEQKQSVPYEAGLPTPNFSGSSGWETKKRGGQGKKRMNFDDETVMKALQKNNDESWEETCILLMQTMLRTIKKYT